MQQKILSLSPGIRLDHLCNPTGRDTGIIPQFLYFYNKIRFFANIKVNFTHHRIIRLPLRAGRSKHFAPCLPGRRQTERLQNQSVSRIIQADKNFLYFFKDGG